MSSKEIKCSCGQTVIEGDIKTVDKRGGGQRKVFIIKPGKVIGYKQFGLFKVYVREQNNMNGEIHKNKSNDPKKWTGKCSKCQGAG